ncbi:trichoplein keratin filament-binding protein isoform X1 [Microcaecilia unicolor]|uniref:Trichoplein keratin filament-binding protein n=2 Tax=Microcaecilia unicolor TaxID=1415580 RepID=A0A6P7Z9G3_9AMPH|nr:trichoplein keratin filament-binding protein isoform X1 [Microcaecilia unicolor]XP_030074201.1 trichoplein keratin filament-binding protein isoform X1 [Microcaecilia unicolor]XP_030074203.1 trichoplein keratin filament-binding protein isoform X1 [Microcaecilia unicolor]XP_030074204.1 trichoplein keratin filament-binding protein isoform X1 [Microcaecilia unicolor]
MALPTFPSYWHNRNKALEQQIVRQRDQEARYRRQWELTSQYFKQSDICSDKQAQWSSRQSYQQSMTAYHREKQKEEKRAKLALRREQLGKLLQEEQDLFEAELRDLKQNKDFYITEIKERADELRSAREERRKQVAEDLMYEHWKKNNARLQEVESTLHKKHVVNAWGDQVSEKKQQEAADQEEKKRFENEYERARREAMERIKEEDVRRKQEEKQRAEILRQQMEELKLREIEAKNLKKEQTDLLKQQWELEELEDQRNQMEERRKKSELGRFLSRQYNAQLKRRAEQIQEELEMDMKILSALIEKEDENQRLQSARREQAAADAAWMKHVIEEQLHLEREREAEVDLLFREEAKQVWAKREEEWERERRARDRLMKEVLTGRQLQIQEKIELNQHAQKRSLKQREQLIKNLEEEKLLTARERAEQEELKTARKQELETQIAEQHLKEQEELLWQKEEAREKKLADEQYEDFLKQEAELMSQRGYQEKVYGRPRTAWS